MNFFTRSNLETYGFRGWIAWRDFDSSDLPSGGGVYVIVHEGVSEPTFRATSTGGWFKGKDPTVSLEVLKANWVPDAHVIYIGKANCLARRLREYARFGQGKPIGHWGGRLIWQLQDASNLLVAWYETPFCSPREFEKQLIGKFRRCYGKAPFANEPDRLGK